MLAKRTCTGQATFRSQLMRSSEMPQSPAGRGWSTRTDGRVAVAILCGEWIARNGDGFDFGVAERILDVPDIRSIAFDTTALGKWDSALLVFVSALRQAARQRDIQFDDTGLPAAVPRLLALTTDAAPPPRANVSASVIARVGHVAIDVLAEAVEVMSMVGDAILRGGAAIRGRARMRGSDVLTAAYEAGVAALPIVTIVNVLVGAILAFVGAIQLRRFGADIYIANLVGVAMVREMAALMTAIVMSGRTGGAYAAHIATMQGNEEIDALRAIGIPVYDYLILPRVLALTFMMPLLYLYASAVGIFGGFVVAISMLNLSPEAFIEQTRLSVAGSQIIFGLVKSVAFGVLIAIAGCQAGIRAGRSAADVGRAATTAVVIGIVGVIALDAVFAVCANALDF